MPYINIRVAGTLSREQKQKIVESVTVLMQEVARENWAKSGRLLDEAS